MKTFHYAQARLQSRHQQRLDEEGWQRLAAIPSFLVFLKQARETALARWLPSIGPATDHEEADRALRLRFREHVAEVAGWLPQEWRPATLWLATITDLASLAHLSAGHPPAPWMLRDATLAPLCQGEAHWGLFEPLIKRWRLGEAPTAAWLGHWRSLWPPHSQKDRPLASFLGVLHSTGTALASGKDGQASRAIHQQLVGQLEKHFRRHLFHPVVAFIHLAMVALEMERLRGALCRRLLFQGELFP